MQRLHADLLLIFAAVIWGVAFIFQKTAMDLRLSMRQVAEGVVEHGPGSATPS